MSPPTKLHLAIHPVTLSSLARHPPLLLLSQLLPYQFPLKIHPLLEALPDTLARKGPPHSAPQHTPQASTSALIAPEDHRLAWTGAQSRPHKGVLTRSQAPHPKGPPSVRIHSFAKNCFSGSAPQGPLLWPQPLTMRVGLSSFKLTSTWPAPCLTPGKPSLGVFACHLVQEAL